jgi:hypothetical protein
VLGFGSRQRLEFFLFTTLSRLVLGPTHLPIQWVTGALSLRIKRPGREADHSPTPRPESKTAWWYTSTPQYVFMAWCLVKHPFHLRMQFLCPMPVDVYTCFNTRSIICYTFPCDVYLSCTKNFSGARVTVTDEIWTRWVNFRSPVIYTKVLVHMDIGL